MAHSMQQMRCNCQTSVVRNVVPHAARLSRSSTTQVACSTCFAFPSAARSMTSLATSAGASTAAERREAVPWPAESVRPGQLCAEASVGAPAICLVCILAPDAIPMMSPT